MIDSRMGQLEILQTVVDAQAKGPGNLTEAVHDQLANLGVQDDQYLDMVMTLKMSRCLDVTEGARSEDGGRVIESINGITTRGLRVLQQASEPPMELHSCPTDGDEGRLGFYGA
jgi:hypothetical protein